jgi:iron complex transport system permease protein
MPRTVAIFVALAALLVVTILVTPHIGAVQLDPQTLQQVIAELRRPRLILAMMAGAGLALAGMTFQALFRNPLAEPFTLGVSSGATLALALASAADWSPRWLGSAADSSVAAGGALLIAAVVYGVARMRSEAPMSTLLLAGVSINFICGAGIILSQYFAGLHEARRLVVWLLGSVDTVGDSRELWVVGGVLAACAAVLAWMHRDLDLLMMGEQVAASRGVEVRRARGLGYLCASLATAGVVSLCGPIAFVGLLVPNIMRAMTGPSHRVLLPACILLGASFLPICDCLAKNFMGWTTANNYTELPVGVVTNVCGGLFFLVVLLKQPGDRPILA